MSKADWLPFRPEFKDAVLSGRKTATCRTKRYGDPGDELRTPFGSVRLTAVVERMLWDVAENYFREEGLESSEDFQQVWKKLHPRAGFRPNDIVYLHRFEVVAS